MTDSSVLRISGLNAFYGQAHVLHDIDLDIGEQAVAVVGRNGMGKTTLCRAIMGLDVRVTGDCEFDGQQLVGRKPHKIAATGMGYVPQGRRIFPSLSTEEHLLLLTGRNPGRWTVDSVFDLFPQLADRRRLGAANLSGGEQQMLAIARALLTNPKLLILDEPSEGLAPAIIDTLIETLQQLQSEDLRLLIVEQNLGVAAALAEDLLVMVNGVIGHRTTASDLLADADAQRRLLGVESLRLSGGVASPDARTPR